jgi:hypothetical protein
MNEYNQGTLRSAWGCLVGLAPFLLPILPARVAFQTWKAIGFNEGVGIIYALSIWGFGFLALASLKLRREPKVFWIICLIYIAVTTLAGWAVLKGK